MIIIIALVYPSRHSGYVLISHVLLTPSCNTDRRRRHHAPRRAAAPTTMIASRRSNNRLPPTHKGTGRVYMIKCIDHGRREGEGHRYTSRAAATTREAEYRRPSTPAVENGHATAQHNRIDHPAADIATTTYTPYERVFSASLCWKRVPRNSKCTTCWSAASCRHHIRTSRINNNGAGTPAGVALLATTR